MNKEKLILPISILLGCLILGGFFYASQRSEHKLIKEQKVLELKAEEEQRISELKAEEEVKQESLAKEIADQQEKEDIKTKLNDCLDGAKKNYTKNWIDECKDRGELPETCKGDKPVPASDCACSLPTTIANRFDDSLTKAKDDCFRMYPQK